MKYARIIIFSKLCNENVYVFYLLSSVTELERQEIIVTCGPTNMAINLLGSLAS
jgi:hypothetical protein